MFPQTQPTDISEVFTFMAELGATGAQDSSDPDYKPQHATTAPLSSTRFFSESYEDGPATAIWYYQRPQHTWDVEKGYLKQLAATLPLKPTHVEPQAEYARFDLLDRIADTLTTAGYPRASTADTLAIFWVLDSVWGWDEDEAKDNLLHCAAYANESRLTPEQRTDLALRFIPYADIAGMLDRNVPYLFLLELFPMA